MNGDRDEVLERRVEAGLRELHGERVPDVTDAVLARLAAGDVVEAAGPTTPRRRAWLAAAIVVLGLGALAMVVFGPRGGVVSERDGEVPALPGDGPEYVEITDPAQIAALPKDTAAVQLRNQDDAAVAALCAHLPELRHLSVTTSTRVPVNGKPEVAVSITDKALPAIGGLRQLQTLHLHALHGIQGPGLREIERLPLLSSLTMSSFDTADEHLQFLPRIPALRRLDLTHNFGIGDGTLAAITQCPGLQALRLDGCSHLQATTLARLGAAAGLRELYLNALGSSWHLGGDSERRARVLNRIEESVAKGAGMRDEALAGWPQLCVLELGGNPQLTAAIGKRIAEKCPELHTLDLSGNGEIDTIAVAHVLRLKNLRRLDLSDCPAIDEHVRGLFQSAPYLLELKCDNAAWMDLQLAEQMMQKGTRVLCQRKDDEAFNQGMAALLARYEDSWLDRQHPVRSVAELETLPAATTGVQLRELGDDAVSALLRFSALKRLELIGLRDRLTAKALVRLGALRNLRTVTIGGSTVLRGDALAPLVDLPQLGRLELVDLDTDDALLAALPRLPALRSLHLIGVRGITDTGMRSALACTALEELRIVNCGAVNGATWDALSRLTSLHTLELRRQRQVDDRAVQALLPLTGLRHLAIAETDVTHLGFRGFEALRRLETLDLEQDRQIAGDVLLQLPPGLQQLVLPDATDWDPAAGTLLRDRFPSLRKLSLARCPWLDDRGLQAVLQLPLLVELDISECTGTTAACLPALRQAAALRHLRANRVVWLDKDTVAQLAAERPDLQVHNRVW